MLQGTVCHSLFSLHNCCLTSTLNNISIGFLLIGNGTFLGTVTQRKAVYAVHDMELQ